MKDKTKGGMKLKKKVKMEEQMEQEDPNCEPPAAKKKKKKDKVTADQENGHIDEATDMNGNSNIETSPKRNTKKNSEAKTEVCLYFFAFLNLIPGLWPVVIAPFMHLVSFSQLLSLL